VKHLFALLYLVTLAPLTFADELQTVAEKSNYTATSRHADVTAFCDALVKRSPLVRCTTFATTTEERKLPLLILSDPPVATPQDAKDKPVVLTFANIHAGEVDGKEAVLALARDLTTEKELLKKVVVLIVPNLNADGNEKISPKNRTSQNGPTDGVGLRTNAQGFDLNRDFVKLESPEVRGLMKVINEWNPLLVVDCHTTNGSAHRYTLTYDGPRHAAADPRLVEMSRSKVLPDLTKRVKDATGYDTFVYGNFNSDRSSWETYPAQPRYGVQCLAIRGCLALLSESYTYAPFEDRVKASYAFVKAAFAYTAEHSVELKKLAAEAAKPRSRVALRSKTVALDGTTTLLGLDGKPKDGKPKEYTVKLVNKVEPTLEVEVPAAYLIPPGYEAVVETLQRHGIKMEELREDIEVGGQGYVVTEFKKSERAFQKHNEVRLEVRETKVATTAKAGSVIVRTAQPLGMLAAFLLEPQSEDGLAAWNFFDKALKVEEAFPVIRLKTVPVASMGPLPVLPEEQEAPRTLTLDDYASGRGPQVGFGGFGASVDWLDGEYFLQTKQGKLMKIEARTGKAEPFVDPAKLLESLKMVKELNMQTEPKDLISDAEKVRILTGSSFRMDKDRTGTLVERAGIIAFAYFDGKPAVRFGKTTPGNELLTMAPDGKHVAYIRAGNLYTAGANGEKQLTTEGGKDEILCGKADWVYFEELFNRNYKAYWWSGNGSRLAFLRFDDKPVKKFSIAHSFPDAGLLESYAYPKPGDPNPLVKIGIVTAEGTSPIYLNLEGYEPESILISRVGWIPGTKTPFAYVQNREQTWLDFLTWPDPIDKPVKLFRETTKAWVEDLGEPKFLKDGTFLIQSERTGWKHVYHYDAKGKLLAQVTKGDWEARTMPRADEKDGWVYVTGTKDGHFRNHLYRAKLDGSTIERLTPSEGTHTVTVAPMGPLFVDRASVAGASKSVLLEVGKGEVRTLDGGAAPREKQPAKLGKYERVQIKTKDGFELEAAITYPPDFDPKKAKHYPIWIQTYAGPHAPTIRDETGGRGGGQFEQALAGSGIVSFRVDPRPASGKGMASAWTAFRQLGVQELKDLEEAVDWICKNEWADATRVGLSGHSYGGYMTAFAMTHSKKFSAGIAGAPVTDWRLYDSIYTERYMGLPKDNKEGYDKSSVVKAAANLHGKLLIAHGLVDDNVHVQNTMQLIDALQRANKEFELMIYPRSRHGIGGAHYTKQQVNFIKKTMGK